MRGKIGLLCSVAGMVWAGGAAAQTETRQSGTSPTTSPAVTAQDPVDQNAPSSEGRTQIVDPTGVPGDMRDDVVVTGIRGAVESATRKKQDSKQIVDSVVAEDVGKLPDNNVPEAIARVSGVGIDRVHGEGRNITIRGLSDVQTTINGNEVGGSAISGTGVESGIAPNRAANLSDIPAELLKAVNVYKTRTADQVEGGIAGTVNVELRRPLDLSKGLTLAGSFREVNSTIGNKWSPYASLLGAYRFDTGIGEMGFLLNGSYTRNNYQENYIFSESPQFVPAGGPAAASLGALADTLYIPYRVTYGVDDGSITRPALNASYQWRPSSHFELVVEGSWTGSRSTATSNTLRLITNDYGYTYSNPQLTSNGALKSITLSGRGGYAGGTESFYEKRQSDNFNTNVEAHWNSGIAKVNASLQYNWDHSNYSSLNIITRFPNSPSATVDFDSSNIPGGGPFITFNGVNYADPSQYVLDFVHDQYGGDYIRLLAGQVDVTLTTSETGLFRSLQFGARGTRRQTGYSFAYRDAGYDQQTAAPPLSTLSPFALATTTPAIPGVQSPTWYNLNGLQAYSQFAALRALLVQRGIVDYSGGDYTADRPAADNGSIFDTRENSWAVYGQVNYGFQAVFPVDGTIGVRLTNTWGQSGGVALVNRVLPNGDCCTTSATRNVAGSNYIDILPNVNAIIHFTPKAQLRLAYTQNVQRPDFASLSGFIYYDATQISNPNSYVYSGNPELKPVREESFDASLEYYFGKGGQLSLGGFVKKQQGFIYYTATQEVVAQLNNTIHYVGKQRNAGPGEVIGMEAAGQTFFDFLPGFASHFGVQGNFTFIPHAELILGDYLGNGIDPSTVPNINYPPFTSRYTYNLALLYDTPSLSARLAYNYRSEYKNDINAFSPLFQTYTRATNRLDASINYTPFKFVTFSVEATNLLRNYEQQFYGAVAALPVGVRVQARTVQLGARFRF